jgi:hypothetical protein
MDSHEEGGPSRRMKRRDFPTVSPMSRFSAGRTLQPEEKLQWLKDANRFLAVALTPAAHAIQERFRRGDL